MNQPIHNLDKFGINTLILRSIKRCYTILTSETKSTIFFAITHVALNKIKDDLKDSLIKELEKLTAQTLYVYLKSDFKILLLFTSLKIRQIFKNSFKLRTFIVAVKGKSGYFWRTA